MLNKKESIRKLFIAIFTISVLINIVFLGSVIFSKKVRNSYLLSFERKLSEILGKENETPPGKWTKFKPTTLKDELSSEQKLSMKKLESLGYLSGFRTASGTKNVTRYNKNAAYNGLNLLCSGHGPEAILLDMEGRILKKWRRDIFSVWPDYKIDSKNHEVWRRVHLMENGDLLAIFEGIGLIKIDKDSNLLWSNAGKAHHDLFVAEDNLIYVLTREAKINPAYNETEPILEDFIALLDQQGKEIKRISIIKCLENSPYAPVLNKNEIKGDFLHTNTIEIVDNKLANKFDRINEGDVLISILGLDMICVINIEKEQVVWALANLWKAQHQPTVLVNGNILIFDNLGQRSNEQSGVIEFDPLDQHIYWKYTGNKKEPFFSKTCGSCQRLPNGNTLISDTEAGRAFEVTPGKEIVWEYFNPFRAGKKKELIAAVYELIRLNPDFPIDWINKDQSQLESK